MSLSPNPPAPAVAEPPSPPYTDAMAGERVPAPAPWWRDAVRSWAPVLGLAALIVFQMVSLQQQIGEIRTDVQREIGSLRIEMHKEMGDLRDDLRSEMSDLRDDLRSEMSDLGERITRLETLIETR